VFTFDDCSIDCDRRELRRGADLIGVEPQVFDVLVYLIRNRDRVVSRDDLLASVWRGRIVSESTLSSRINAARTAIGDSGDQQRLIRTIARKGFRFVGEVREVPGSPSASASDEQPVPRNMKLPRSTDTPAPRLPEKPSIAVLPFTNLSGDPEQDYFADGMVEEIVTALSRFSNLFVIARNSSFTYRGRDVDANQVGRELGVRYLLEGSVRRAGNRIRLAGQLIDVAKGVHLWAERFDGALTDIFGLQDQMTTSVVSAIIPKMSQAELERAKHKPTESLDAYDYYMRGVALTYYDTKDAFSDARQHFLKAMALDPHYALAHAAVASCFEARMRNGWMSDRLAEIEEAKKLARQAAELGRDDALALAVAGFVLARVAGDLDDAPGFIDKALALNANLARAWQHSGWVRIWLGEPELAIEHATRAMRLSPVDPWLCSMHTAIAFAHFFMGRYDEASSSVAAALRDRPHFQPALRLAAANHAVAGRMEKANEAVARLRALNPGLRLSNLKAWRAPQRRPEFSSMYEEGLRKAGLPE